jgi:hypothetical protein
VRTFGGATFGDAGERVTQPEAGPSSCNSSSAGTEARRSRESQRERRSASLRRTAMSFFTTAFGRGRSTAKCSEPLVIV